MMDIRVELYQWIIKRMIKISLILLVRQEHECSENQQLAAELHKPIIRKFQKRKVYSSFKNNI